MFMLSSMIISENGENRLKIGITDAAYDRDRFFFNQAISDILFHNDPVYKDPVQTCVEKLSRIVMVSVEVTSADALQLENTIRGGQLSFWTFTGGLLSLFAGFSSLSLAEIVFWLVRGIINLVIVNN